MSCLCQIVSTAHPEVCQKLILPVAISVLNLSNEALDSFVSMMNVNFLLANVSSRMALNFDLNGSNELAYGLFNMRTQIIFGLSGCRNQASF